MRKYCRFAFAFVVVLLYLFTSQIIVNSATTIADKVRVGLYFGSNAVSTFGISGGNGLVVSCFKDNNNVPILEESTNNVLTVKKDDYFHIQIGKQLADLMTASAVVTNIRAKGIDAFVTYFDGWFVWSGLIYNKCSSSNRY